MTPTAEQNLKSDLLDELASLLERFRPLVVVGGAGISTASGIPDYRDTDGNWKNASPIQYGDFVSKPAMRQRYWARSYAGWLTIRDAQPNAAHQQLAGLERDGIISTLIAQNVDGLHQKAGSRNVIDLHGRLDRVICLDCSEVLPREAWQQELADANPGWEARVDYFKPDGDAELSDARVSEFNVPNCPSCGGMVKPDVVFFGENVPAPRVEKAMQAVDDSAGLLVVGSSMMVFSGFRFARKANEQSKPVIVVNRGRTRVDEFARFKLEGDIASILSATQARL